MGVAPRRPCGRRRRQAGASGGSERAGMREIAPFFQAMEVKISPSNRVYSEDFSMLTRPGQLRPASPVSWCLEVSDRFLA